LQFAQVFTISFGNLNETLPIFLDGFNCTQVRMKLFQLPNVIEAVGIYPNVSTVIACKFRWSTCMVPKLEWSSL